jgi:hypothetical protein
MKPLIVTFIFSLAGLNANACPDLTGSYRCQSASRAYDMVIEQRPVGENMQYWFIDPRAPNDRSDTTITDGVTRKVEDSGTVKRKTIKGWCEGEKLLDFRTGDFYQNGELWSSFELSSTYYFKEKNLIWDETGKMTFPVSHHTVCRPR